ncbi:MAG: TdeIII family type II restriction endonuclease [Patescibacteria group bacterium]|nr:TdeIII family type II restriction endonuclease [Patescibacteria group bacterium]
MALTSKQKEEITRLLEKKIKEKLTKYSRESVSMPFLSRLMQDDEKVAAYSFIHSLATTLGMSIYEDVSVIITKNFVKECSRNYDIGGAISSEQKSKINEIIRKLRNGDRVACFQDEAKEVLVVSSDNGKNQKEGRIADFYMLKEDTEHYFEIKTVKPNIDVFTASKTKLLEWVARRGKPIKAFLAFPYNPYYPLPYSRFTEQGVMERGQDFLVGEEYWDLLGGKGTYSDLLELFDNVGKKYKDEIKNKIEKVATEKIK